MSQFRSWWEDDSKWPEAAIVMGVVLLVLGITGYTASSRSSGWDATEQWQMALGAGSIAAGVIALRARRE